MSWFMASDNLSGKAMKILTRMSQSGASEGEAVADCLNTIAENGEGSETDEHLMACAQEIIDWAASFITEMGGTPGLPGPPSSKKEGE